MYYIQRIMFFSEKKINKIYNCKNLTNKEKVDRLLEMDAIQYVNCGIETTKGEKRIIKENSKLLYNVIQKIDPELGNRLLYNE